MKGFLLQILRDQNCDLYTDLNKIIVFCKDIWKNKLMIWYTNHDHKHSEEIIFILDQILYPLSKYEKDFLNTYELFMLLSSAYLHDIGMQSSKIEKIPFDMLTTDHHCKIRKRHAEESHKIIMRSTLNSIKRDDIRLPQIDEEFIPFIANICMGHSTDFIDTVNEKFCTTFKSVKNEDIRGQLLASLLLIADELDLTRKRVDMSLLQGIELSPISKVHWYKHYYTQKVRIINKTINIDLVFPSKSEGYSYLFENLIRNKLNDQIKQVNPILSSSTNGLLSFNEKIAFNVNIDDEISNRNFPHNSIEILVQTGKNSLSMPLDEALKDYVRYKKNHHNN